MNVQGKGCWSISADHPVQEMMVCTNQIVFPGNINCTSHCLRLQDFAANAFIICLFAVVDQIITSVTAQFHW